MATLRNAAPQEAPDFFQLLRISDSEFMPTVFGPRFERVVTRLYQQGGNIFSHQHTRLCVEDNRVAGMCYAFDGTARDQLAFSTGLAMVRAMGLAMFTQLPSMLVSDQLLGRLEPHCCYISNIAVRSEFQGRGLGALLLRDAEERALHHGQRTMLLDVRSNNAQATAVYAKSGYARGPVRTLHLHGRAFEYLRMHKELRAL